MSTNEHAEDETPGVEELPLGHDHAPVPVNKYWDGSLHIPLILGAIAALLALISSIWKTD
ncbi:MAG: hypothetical protein HYV07_25095 [Deltaproteobacteria bacterium]|nr:hypothetical protein [Deltaproteobacteria bacterium]